MRRPRAARARTRERLPRRRRIRASRARCLAAGRHRRSAAADARATRRWDSMTSTMRSVCMRPLVACAAALLVLCAASPVRAQDPPPRIGPFVLDLHASLPQFPTDDAQLAASRGMALAELPGTGLGMQAGAHLYLLKIKAVTFG